MPNAFTRLRGLAKAVMGGAKPHFVVIDVKRQSLSDMTGQTLHEQRKAGDLTHVDPTKTKDNQRGGHGGHGDNPKAAVEAFIKDGGIVIDRRNTRPITSLVLSASHDFFDSDETRKKWVAQSMKWARDEFGDDIAHASLHLDERTPHIHLKVVPTYEKKTKRKTVRQASHHKHKAFEGRRSYEGLLDRYSAQMAPLGLLRGERVPEKAGRTHQSARQWVNDLARRWSGRAAEIEALDAREAKVAEREARAASREDSLSRQAQDLVWYREGLEEKETVLRKKVVSIESAWMKDKALSDIRAVERTKVDPVVAKRVEKRARRAPRKGRAPAER